MCSIDDIAQGQSTNGILHWAHKVGCGDRIWLFSWVRFKAPACHTTNTSITHTTNDTKRQTMQQHPPQKSRGSRQDSKNVFCSVLSCLCHWQLWKKCHSWKHDLENSMKEHVAVSILSNDISKTVKFEISGAKRCGCLDCILFILIAKLPWGQSTTNLKAYRSKDSCNKQNDSKMIKYGQR